MKITHCKLNHLVNPLGYALPQLRFSWQTEDCRGTRQTAARLIISENADLTGPVYDSGFADLDSLGTKVQLQTKPRTRYYWSVTVRTDADEEATSEPNYFETAKQEEPWIAKWITCDNAEPRHPIFCKTLPYSDIAAARLYICGLGLYEATLNGEKIGCEYLTPYCNNYNRWLQYQTYDITTALQKGGDLQITLGNGWYRGRFGFQRGEKPYYGTDWLLLAEVHITHTDGSEEIIGTDESWQVHRSKITFSNIYDGEHCDATLPELPVTAAALAQPPKGSLTARYSVPVQPFAALTPTLLHTPAEETVLDLGQNMAGSFTLRVNVPAGQTVRLQWGETLQNGNFYRDNLHTAKAEYIYVSDGKPAVLAPKFTFYGGRYVKVEGVPDLMAEDFTPLPLSSTLEHIGTLTTGHELVNRLIENVRWSCRDNFIDVPTDCPQRDERMGWTGDAQVFAPTAGYMLDTVPFYTKYLHDMATEQADCNGKVPNVVPSFGMQGCSSVWGDAAAIIPWVVYEQFGDTAILDAQYDSMKSWVDYITRVDSDCCRWREEFHYGDWLALDVAGAAPDNTKGATDDAFIADVYYMNSAEIVAAAAKILGKSEDITVYTELASRLRKRILQEFYTPTGRCAVPTVTGYLLTLRHHLVDTARTAADLRKKLTQSHNKLQTGFVGTALLCNVLSENGMHNLAEQLLLNEEYPGWLHEVKLGATTIWERWNSLDENGQISSTGMNSLNHYSYGAILEWMYRHLAGLQPLTPGFTSVHIEPTPVWKLRRLDCSYRSAAGLWAVQWQCADANTLTLAVTVPFGCTAELILPNWNGEITDNPIFADRQNGICRLKPGQYAVTYTTARPLHITLSAANTIAELLNDQTASTVLTKMMPGITQLPARLQGMPLASLMRSMGQADDAALNHLNQVLAAL